MALLSSNFRTEFDAQNAGNGVSVVQISMGLCYSQIFSWIRPLLSPNFKWFGRPDFLPIQ
jgi:hypothetical protein